MLAAWGMRGPRELLRDEFREVSSSWIVQGLTSGTFLF